MNEKTVKYEAEYRYYWCFDDGGIGHDVNSDTATKLIQATNDKATNFIEGVITR